MKICFHTHCFPDKLASRAIGILAANAAPFGFAPHTDGTAAGAKALLSSAGIGGALICNIATNAKQETNVNNFAISVARERGFFFAAGSVHPDSGKAAFELDRLREAGIRGIKIHPDYVGVDITDDRFDRIFGLCEERDMFVVTHCGFDPVSSQKAFAPPSGLLEVIKRRPKLKLIAAHLGGPRYAKEVLSLLAGTGIRFDTSLSATRPDERDELINILKEHDDSLILFGTDLPWSLPASEIAFLENAGFGERRLENVFYRNAAKLLGL